jgi:hypothetical protein
MAFTSPERMAIISLVLLLFWLWFSLWSALLLCYRVSQEHSSESQLLVIARMTLWRVRWVTTMILMACAFASGLLWRALIALYGDLLLLPGVAGAAAAFYVAYVVSRRTQS